MTENELEDLKEIEKDFDKETAKKLLRRGYRKVFFETQCEKCGKKFLNHVNNRCAYIEYFGESGLTQARVALCPTCKLDLNNRRIATDNQFYNELRYRRDEE